MDFFSSLEHSSTVLPHCGGLFIGGRGGEFCGGLVDWIVHFGLGLEDGEELFVVVR